MSQTLSEQLNNVTNKLFNEYLESLIFYKIKENGGLYSLYYSRIKTQTMSGYNYIIATVNQDNNIPGTSKKITELDWVTLQSRELSEEYLIRPCNLVVTKSIENIFSQIILTKKNSSSEITTYTVENEQYPFEAGIIHKKDYETYPDRIPLNTAIKSFKLLIMKYK